MCCRWRAVLFLALVVNSSCASASLYNKQSVEPVPDSTPVNSINIREMWEKARKNLNPQSKNYPGQKIDILMNLLNQAPGEQVRQEEEKLRLSAIDFTDPLIAIHPEYEYEQTLLEAFVIRHIRAKDREGLVKLLSYKCPRYIYTTAIELYLSGSHTGLSAPLLILFDSYETAVNDQQRRSLLRIIRDAFQLPRGENSSDQDYVASCRQWYLENINNLKVNLDYVPNTEVHTPGTKVPIVSKLFEFDFNCAQ